MKFNLLPLDSGDFLWLAASQGTRLELMPDGRLTVVRVRRVRGDAVGQGQGSERWRRGPARRSPRDKAKAVTALLDTGLTS